MKVAGKSLTNKNRSIVKLKRENEEISLTLSPLPAGFMLRLRVLGVSEYPDAPIVAKTAPNGRILKNENRQIEYVPNENDPQYKKDTAKITMRIRAMQLREHLRDDPSVSFDAVAPVGEDSTKWIEYADELAKEVYESGFTDEEIAEIITQGSDLANGIQIEGAVDRFL